MATCRSEPVGLPGRLPSPTGLPGLPSASNRPGPIHPGLQGRAQLSPTVLRHVVVESSEPEASDNPREESRVDLATQ